MKLFQFAVAILLYAIGAAFIAPACFGQNDEATPRQEVARLLKEAGNKLRFEENLGQWDSDILYLAHSSKGLFRVLKDGISLVLHQDVEDDTSAFPERVLVWNYRFENMNSDRKVEAIGLLKSAGISNYYKAGSQHTNVNSYQEIRFKGIYDDIDLRLYGDGLGGLEYDFIVYPGGDINDILIRHEGIKTLIKKGEKCFAVTILGDIELVSPYSYQEKDGEEKQIPIHFVAQDKLLSFAAGEGTPYDPDKILIIDPLVLSFSTFLGGTRHEASTDGAMDNDGNLVSVGHTQSIDYPVTPGAFQSSAGGGINGYDVFLIKYSPSGSIIFSTYLGGHSTERPRGLGIDSDNSIRVAGSTGSTNFPIQNAFDSICSSAECWVAKFNPAGGMLWSTFYGGSNEDNLHGIHFLDDGRTVIFGGTESIDLPVTPNAFQSSFGGYEDCFAARIGADGSLEYSTYIGGNNAEPTNDGEAWLKVLEDSSWLIFGGTTSTTWNFTSGAYQAYNNTTTLQYPQTDGFLVRILADGSAALSTFIGGTAQEVIQDAVMLDDGSVIVAGVSGSIDFPVSTGAFDTYNPEEAYSGPTKDGSTNEGIVARFSPTGGLIWSTYLGGEGDEKDVQLVKHSDGSVVVTGLTRSTQFPVTSNAFQANFGGGYSDFFATKFDSSGSVLWSTYLGGSADEEFEQDYANPEHSYIYPDGSVGIYGYSKSVDYPTTPGAADAVNYGINSYSRKDIVYTKIQADGDSLDFSTFLGGSKTERLYKVVHTESNAIVIFGKSWSDDYPLSPDALQRDAYAAEFITKLCPLTGNIGFSTYFGSETQNGSSPTVFGASDTVVFMCGAALASFPVSVGAAQTSPNGTYTDVINVVIKTNVAYSSDSIYPKYQEACKLSNDLEKLYGPFGETVSLLRNGSLDQVKVIPPYQWQFSLDSNLWQDIPDAHNYFYQPQATSQTTWFRRTVKDCGNIVAVSSISKLFIRNESAPTVSTEPIIYLCPGGSIDLGGSPTASGGSPPYTYEWTPSKNLNDPTIANPTTTLTQNNVIFTLRVEDAAQCSQIRQTKLISMELDPIPDLSICPGVNVVLKVKGFDDPLVTYQWTALGGSGGSSIQSPDSMITVVNPSVTTTYQIYVNDGKSSGGICPLESTEVEVVTPPVANAGPDLYICEGQGVNLGVPGHKDFVYIWTPGDHLSSPLTAQPFYDGFFPIEDSNYSMQYILTVLREESLCVADYDTMNVFVSFSNASIDGCGPRIIGTPDPSGGQAEFQWTVLYGDSSSLIGQDTLPMPLVNPSKTTLYQLSVSLNGATCISVVEVPDCGCLIPAGTFTVPIQCTTGAQRLPFKLMTSNINPNLYHYEWTGGDISALSDPFVAQPYLVSPLSSSQVYTLRATHKLDSTLSCTTQIPVNIALTGKPIALVSEDIVICPQMPFNPFIGAASVPGYNYEWFPSTGLSADNVSNPSVELEEEGSITYRLIVSDNSNGCQDTAFVTVTMREPVADAGPDRLFCGVGTFILGSPPQSGMSYFWEPTQIVTDSTNPLPLVTIYPGLNQVYLTVTDTITGCIDRDTVEFAELSPVSANAGSDTIVCSLSPEAMIGDPNYDPALIYTWIPTTGIDDPSSGYTIVEPTSTTTYTLLVSRANAQGCDAESYVTVTLAPPAWMYVDAGPDTAICQGDEVRIGPPAEPNKTYLWSPAASLDNPNQAQTWAEPSTSPTSYTVLVKDYDNCLQGSDQVNISWKNLGIPTVSPQAICPGDSATIGVTYLNGAVYSWNPSSGLNNDSSAMVKASPMSSTTYELEVDYEGCVYVFEFDVNVIPAPIANAGSDLNACGSGSQIGSSPATGFAYSWAPSAGLSNPSIANPLALPTDTTTYVLSVTNLAYGCAATDTVVVYPFPVADAGNDKIICQGETIQLGTPGRVGYTYSWTPTTGLSNPGIARPMAKPQNSVTYELQVSHNGCTVVDQVFIEVRNPGSLQIYDPGELCMNECTNLFVAQNNGPFTNFQWTPASGVSPTNVTNPELCLSATSIVTVTAFHPASGCFATDTITVLVHPNPVPIANAGSDTTICYGESLVLGQPGSNNLVYEWGPAGYLNQYNIAQPIATPSYGMDFELTVTDPSTSCSSYDNVYVDVILVDAEVLSDDYICYGQVASLQGFGALGEDNFLTYRWEPASFVVDPESANAQINVASTTSFTFTVLDTLHGCEASDIGIVYVSQEPGIDVDLGKDITLCYTGSLDSIQIGIPAVPGLLYSWSPTNNLSNPHSSNPWLYYTKTFNSIEYTLYVEDTSTYGDCGEASDEINIRCINKPSVYIYPGSRNICPGQTVTLYGSIYNVPNGASSMFSWSPSSDVSNPFSLTTDAIGTQSVNTYTLSVNLTDDATQQFYGCKSSAYSVITLRPAVDIKLTEKNIACSPTNQRLLPVINDPLIQHYSWSPENMVVNGYYVGMADTVLTLSYYTFSGCSFTRQLQINLSDKDAPIILCPSDTSIDCSADTSIANLGIPLCIDNCDTMPIISHKDEVITGHCVNQFTIERTWYGSDSAGNKDSCTQVISVVDTVAPVLVCPPDLVIDCPADTSVSITGMATATDQCSPLVIITYSDSVLPGCGNTFTVIRTFIAIDECRNETSCTQTIIVQDTTPPSISCPPNLVLNCPADTTPSNTGFALANDICGNVTISYSDTVTPGCGNTFTLQRTWTATDECGLTSSCTQIITVQDTSPPTIFCPPDLTLNCPADTAPANTGIATAGDVCGSVTITYSDDVTSGCGNTFTLLRIWTASDQCGLTASCAQTIIVQDTSPPSIICPPDTLIDCTADTTPANTGYATGGDVCGSVIVSYVDDVSPGCGNTFTLHRTWTVTDECGLSASCVQTITIQDTTPPVITCPACVELQFPADTSVATNGYATATEECGNVFITYSDSVIPITNYTYNVYRTWYAEDECGNVSTCLQTLGVLDTLPPVISCPSDTVIDCPADTSVANLGVATAVDAPGSLIQISHSDVVIPDCSNSFTIERTWIATDGCGNTALCIQQILVQDTTAPLILCPPDVVMDCPADTSVLANGFATASDECAGYNISYSDVVTPGCGNAFVVARTWRATDDCGNFTECAQTLTVQDTTPPLITCPANITITADYGSCEDVVTVPAPQVSDECSDWTLLNDYNGTDNASDTYPAGTTLVTWTLTDDCGNASSCVQTIVVKNYPLAHDDDTIVPTGATVAFDVLQNDFDCLGRIDPECVSILSHPFNGSLSVHPLTGIITYTPYVPTLNFTDTYQYIMCNEFGLQDTATVTITYMKPPTAKLMGGGVICKYNASYLVVHLTGQTPWSFALYDGYTTTVYAGLTQSIWTKNVSPVSSRDYTILWVQDATSLKVPGTGSASVTIASPAQFTITGGGTYNQGDPGKIIGLNGSQTGVEYQLFVNTAPVGAPVMGSGAPISFGYQTTPGFYTVRATDVTAFCSEHMLGSAQITMNPAPATCSVSGGGICCMGCYDLDIILDCSESGIRYELYRDGQATGKVKYGNGDTLVWEDLNMEGIYTIKATNPSTGANVMMDGFATVEFFLIPVAILSGSTTIIEGQQAILNISLTGTPPFRFGLFDGDTEILYENVMAYSLQIPVSPVDTTSYNINWVTDSAGCGDYGYGTALVNVIPLKFGSIAGTVQYQSNQPFPLAGVDLSLKDDQGNTLAQTTSGADGGYLFSSIPPGNYSLVPAFNDIPGGINATDALLSMQHFTGLTSLGPIALKAADVNASGMVNATDAYGIAMHFVNPGYTFPSGRWAFIAPQVTIPPQGSSQIAHIQALCYGDVNASFDPLKTFFVQDLKQEGEIIATSEEAIKIPVFAERSARVAALSIRMDYPEELLAVRDVILAGESEADLLVNIQNGSIRVSWFDLEPIQIEQQKPILYLLAAPRKAAWNQDHSLVLRVSSESQLADINAEPIAMEYSIPKLTLLSAEPSLRVVPNPFTSVAAVKFTLPLDGRISLELFNALGQKSQTLVDAFKVAGSHQLSLDSRNLAPGVYMLRLTQETDKGMVQQSLRIIKE